jgi:hypothetical protein
MPDLLSLVICNLDGKLMLSSLSLFLLFLFFDPILLWKLCSIFA